MQVRDRTKKLSEYKGRWTDAYESVCPCRPCYNAHDCGHQSRVYNRDGVWSDIEHIVRMECATRYNYGCPHPMKAAEHMFPVTRTGYCRRCAAARGRG